MEISYGVFGEKEGTVVAWHESNEQEGSYVLTVRSPFGRIMRGIEIELTAEQIKELIVEIPKDEIESETINYAEEIITALSNVPGEIALIFLTDIDKRISDWLASGGKPNARYIQQQVNYAKRISERFGTKKSLTAGKQSQ